VILPADWLAKAGIGGGAVSENHRAGAADAIGIKSARTHTN